MSDWQEEGNEHWPVKYPAKASPQASTQCCRDGAEPRWTGIGKADTHEIQKRFLWLLFAVEIGLALAAACLLPLAFVRLPIGEEGVFGAILAEGGRLLGLSSQVICLALALPPAILLLMLGVNRWLYRWLQRSGKG